MNSFPIIIPDGDYLFLMLCMPYLEELVGRGQPAGPSALRLAERRRGDPPGSCSNDPDLLILATRVLLEVSLGNDEEGGPIPWARPPRPGSVGAQDEG